MKKMLKRTLSVVLSILMICTTAPLFAFAKEEATADNDVTFSNGVGLNGIINALSGAEDSKDYSIVDLEIEAKIATVTLANKEACTLVVAVYDENSGRLLATGIEEIIANIGVAEVTLDITAMPKKYLAKAFLLDSNLSPLCKEYIDYSHTNAYLEYLDKEPEDFKGDEVIIFDETKEQTDFAVLTDNVTVSEKTSGMTFSYDESTKTYTFKNAVDEVKNLSVGDVYYWEYGKQAYEFLLFKVKSISKTGSTVKIVEDEGISLSDAFEFIRVDTDGDYSDVEINEDELGSAFRVVDEVSAQEFNYDESGSFSSTLKLDYTMKENESGSLSASISGTLGFKLSVSIKLVYDIKLFAKDYYEFKSEIKTNIGLQNITVEGKISLPKSVSKIEVTPVPVGPFLLTPIAHLIIELSLSVSFTITHETTITVTADRDNGFKKHRDSDSDWDVKVDDELQIKVGLGIEAELSFAKIVSLSLRADCGVKYTGNLTTVGAWINKLHDCYACYYGDVDFFITGTVTLKIKIIEDILDFEWVGISLSTDFTLFDFHISLSAKGFSCGKGECKNVWYPVTVAVTGDNKESGLCENIVGATVSTSTGKCDSDNDKIYDEKSIETNEDGEAVLYFPSGANHKITVSADGYKSVEKTFSVYGQEKYISVLLGSEEEPPVVEGDTSYTYNATTKTLTISGTGAMTDYINYSAAPWHGYYLDIKKIVVEEGVTSIGNYAFAQCRAATSITLPSSITKIGMGAFYGCNAVSSITIGDKVKSVGDYAFYDCYQMETLNIGKSLESIGSYAFAQCTSLQSVVLPVSVKSIGMNAFAWCAGLSSITINNKDCNIYDSEATINYTATIYGVAGSTAKAYASKYSRTFRTISGVSYASDDAFVSGQGVTAQKEGYLAKCSGALAGEEYVIIVVKSSTNGFNFDNGSLLYIDQKTQQTDGTISFEYIPKDDVNCKVAIFGKFNGTNYQVVTPIDMEIPTSVKIVSVPNKTEYTYKDTSISLEGIKIEVTYTDGTVETITDTKLIDVENFDTSSTGTKKVTLDVYGKEVQYDITVKYAWWQWIIIILLFGWIWY